MSFLAKPIFLPDTLPRMTNAELYNYYAPDERIYGPIDRGSLQKWEQEGRLVPSSKLLRKGETEFTTWEKVKSTPPVPSTEVSISPSLPSDSFLTPPYDPPSEFPSTLDLLGESVQLYIKNFKFLVLWSCIIQVATLLIIQLAELALQYLGGQHTLSAAVDPTSPAVGPMMSAMVLSFLALTLMELWIGLLTVLTDYLRNQRKVSIKEILSRIPGVIVPIALSAGIRIILPICGLIPFSIALQAAFSLKTFLLVRVLLCAMSAILLIPPVLLVLRLLLTTQVIMLEGRKGFPALQRSNTLVRYNPGENFFSCGELKVLCLVLIPFLSSLLLNVVFLRLSGIHLSSLLTNSPNVVIQTNTTHTLLLQSIVFVGGFLITPLYTTIIYCYYHHACEHVETV